MIRDITLGQYYPTKSLVHALDPRAKLFVTFVYMLSLFIADSLIVYACVIAALAVVIRLTNAPPKFMFRGLKSLVVIVVFSALLNLFSNKSGSVIADIGFAKITTGGLRFSVIITLRLIMLVVGSSIITLTTLPSRLTDAIEDLLKPFERFGLPASDIAMTISVALRFIPTLLEETDRIMKAQQARGADFETGGIIKRAKNFTPALVPLFLSAIRRAEDLALAMEARCYDGGKNRTRLNASKFGKNDFIAVSLGVLYLSAIIITRLI